MHEVILVIAPDIGKPYGDDDFSDIMNPYWEELAVEEYETECYCVNFDASCTASRVAGEKFPMEDIREKFNEAVLEAMPQALKDEQAKWNSIMATATPEYKHDAFLDFANGWNSERIKIQDELDIKNWRKEHDKLEKKTLENHPLYQKPDPKCEECEGTGEYMTTCNPDGHWDWYVVGGRWAGMLKGLNQMPVDELIKLIEDGDDNLLPNTIVDEYGWHSGEADFMGPPKPEWEKEALEHLRVHEREGMVAVIIDIHH